MGTNQTLVASFGVRETFGNAPIAPRHGSGLPFTGMTTTATGTSATAATYAAPQLAAVRKDDARVPDPRGRQR